LFAKAYPTIKGISIEMAGSTAALFASVDGLSRKIPLTLASGGMNKLVAILLSIAANVGGLVLVDEIENGFYYAHMADIWNALFVFARKYRCQLFLSTHSYECLTGVAGLAKDNPSEVAVIRSRLVNGETKLRRFGGEKFVEAIDGNVEIR
jgi:AAA15 family ATPase/GTPase